MISAVKAVWLGFANSAKVKVTGDFVEKALSAAEEQMGKRYSLQAGMTLTSLHPGCMHLTQVEPGKKRKRVAALYAIGWQETLVLVWLK